MTTREAQTTSAQPQRAPASEEEQHAAAALGDLALAPAAPPGELPNHSTARPLRRAALLRRQAQQGNHAIQRALRPALISRDTPAPAADPQVKTGLDASMLKVNVMKQPATSGAVSVSKIGSDKDGYAEVVSPEIKGEYGVEIVKDVKIGPGAKIKVGPVQTLVSSERVGVYKKDGKVIAEQRFNMADVRDARPLSYGDGSPTFAAESPFYDKPVELSDESVTGGFTFVDKPRFRLPLEFGGGRLSAVRGADKFNTSVGAKRDGAIITMNPFGWQVDWTTELGDDFTVPVDANGNPVSKGITMFEEKQGRAIDSEMYADKLKNQIDPTVSFKTLDAALATPSSLLLVYLPMARRNDPDSAQLIEQALTQKNPTIQVKLTATKTATHNIFSADEDSLEVFANISKQPPNKGPFTFQAGTSHSVDFKLNDLADAASLGDSAVLKVWLGGAKDVAILGEFTDFPYPFMGTKTVALHKDQNGSYTISVSLS